MNVQEPRAVHARALSQTVDRRVAATRPVDVQAGDGARAIAEMEAAGAHIERDR